MECIGGKSKGKRMGEKSERKEKRGKEEGEKGRKIRGGVRTSKERCGREGIRRMVKKKKRWREYEKTKEKKEREKGEEKRRREKKKEREKGRREGKRERKGGQELWIENLKHKKF